MQRRRSRSDRARGASAAYYSAARDRSLLKARAGLLPIIAAPDFAGPRSIDLARRMEIRWPNRKPSTSICFRPWLRSLGEDAEALGELIARADAARSRAPGARGRPELPVQVARPGAGRHRRHRVPGRRVRAARRVRAGAARGGRERAGRAAARAAASRRRRGAVREFLGADFARLEGYVTGLRKVAARGRSVQDIVHNADVQSAFLSDVRGLARAYQAPELLARRQEPDQAPRLLRRQAAQGLIGQRRIGNTDAAGEVGSRLVGEDARSGLRTVALPVPVFPPSRLPVDFALRRRAVDFTSGELY